MPKHPKQGNGGGLGHDTGGRPPGSFEEFYRRHRAPFIKLLSRYMSAHDAEDLAQQVFLAVWQAQKVREVRNPYALAMRILKHARVDLWRKQRARRKHEDQFARDCEPLQAPPADTESAAMEEEEEQIRLLMELSKEHPEAFRAYCLREYGGLGYADIAKVMGIGRNKAARLFWIGMRKVNSIPAKEGNACAL